MFKSQLFIYIIHEVNSKLLLIGFLKLIYFSNMFLSWLACEYKIEFYGLTLLQFDNVK